MTKATATTPKTGSKRVRTESTRKRTAKENEDAIKDDRAALKAVTKARKERRAEAAEDDLFVERDGESPELTKLRVIALRLDSDNRRMSAKLARRKEERQPVKLIPEPQNKAEIGIQLIRIAMGMSGPQFDAEWSIMRHDWRSLMSVAGFDFSKTWNKQDMDRINTLVHASEERYPIMKDFENHWGILYILQESFNNVHYYHRKRVAESELPLASRRIKSKHTRRAKKPIDTTDEPDHEDNARTAAFRKAAVERAAQRHAARRKAEAEEAEAEFVTNDGETEIEDLPDNLRKYIKETEIGTTGTPHKPRAESRLMDPSSDEDTPTPKDPVGSGSQSSKPKPVIYLKRGLGPKGKSQNGKSSNSRPRDDDQVSSSSGQTTSDEED